MILRHYLSLPKSNPTLSLYPSFDDCYTWFDIKLCLIHQAPIIKTKQVLFYFIHDQSGLVQVHLCSFAIIYDQSGLIQLYSITIKDKKDLLLFIHCILFAIKCNQQVNCSLASLFVSQLNMYSHNNFVKAWMSQTENLLLLCIFISNLVWVEIST